MTLARAAALAAVLAVPRLAHAHAPIEGIGSFWAGLLHPLMVPAHAVTVVALGLMLGQQGPAAARAGLIAFVATLITGMLIGDLAPGREAVPLVLLVLALALGALCASALTLPYLVPTLPAGAAGALIGIDSAADLMVDEDILLIAGIALGATLGVFYPAGIAAALERPWQRIGIRIVGSWAAASALMVLVLRLAGPGTTAAG